MSKKHLLSAKDHQLWIDLSLSYSIKEISDAIYELKCSPEWETYSTPEKIDCIIKYLEADGAENI